MGVSKKWERGKMGKGKVGNMEKCERGSPKEVEWERGKMGMWKSGKWDRGKKGNVKSQGYHYPQCEIIAHLLLHDLHIKRIGIVLRSRFITYCTKFCKFCDLYMEWRKKLISYSQHLGIKRILS